MIDETRWRRFSFYQQMGNIASELSRAAGFEKKRNEKQTRSALWRLLELVDLTIEDPKNRSRLRELCRFKEILADWYCGTGIYRPRPESLKRYAMDFALLARKGSFESRDT